jgi:hypothetical protein
MLGDFLLTDEDQQELSAITDEVKKEETRHDKLKPVLRPLWLFFIALCYALHEGETDLTATDAYWLGLINEVVGRQDLPNERLAQEATPSLQLTLKPTASIATATPAVDGEDSSLAVIPN